MIWALEAAGPAAIATVMRDANVRRKTPYVPPIVSHSREMPAWARNNHKPNAAQYAELMLDADIQAALKPLLNPFKLPKT